MCGIAAIFSPSEPVLAPPLEKAVKALYHRGPDGNATWVAPSRQAGLAHARLSIIDLATGGQPLHGSDGTTSVVVNGELYGFEAIRAELEGLGHEFRTKSDSEIVLPLYERYGTSCLQRLRGEFAIALWDEKERVFFAARDRFGIKPLFYAEQGGRLLVASEIKALLAMGVAPRWDEEAFAQSVAIGNPLADRTYFAGVRQVPPGHFLLATQSGTRVVPYWDFDYPTVVDRKTSETEWIERYRAALDEAVRLRLRADVPVGCYLSGGLDSCSVLGIAAKHLSRPIRAFTLGFDRAEYDETAIAKEMAEKAGAEFVSIPMAPRALVDNFAAAVRAAESLVFNAHGVAKFVLSRAVRDAGYKVVLTGEGSDETLGGYVHFRRDMLLYDNGGQDQAEVERLLAELVKRNEVSRGIMIRDGQVAVPSIAQVLGFVPSWLENSYRGAQSFESLLLSDDFLARRPARDSQRFFLDTLRVREQLAGREKVNQSLYLWSKVVLPNYILTVLGDRMEMAHSVEGRVPFLDHEVVAVAAAMPVSMKIRGMTEKYVLREAARPVLTDTVYRRQKHPFVAPPAIASGANALDDYLWSTLAESSAATVPFFDMKKIAALRDRLAAASPELRAQADPGLTVALSAVLLQREFRLTA